MAISRATVNTGDARRPADGDQPFVGGVVASWDIAQGWNLGLRYRLGSGLPHTPIDEGVYDATQDQWIPVPGADNSERLPLYQKIDLHVAYTWDLPRWTLTVSVDVWYVPKPSAQLYPTWNYDFSEQGWVVGPTLLPLAGARAKF